MSEEKDVEARRTGMLMVRLSAEERRLIDAAAGEDSIPSGTWLRSIGVREARAREKKREKRG